MKKLIIFFFFLLFKEKYLITFFEYIIDQPKLSIIIPIFNREKYLSACLNSVINQTLKNIEIICVDDGSTDNSTNILKSFKNLDNRIIIISQTNHGSGYSRNKGINLSNGKYISFLDSDDMYYDNHALKLLYEKAKKFNAIICGGGMKKILKIKNRTIINYTFFENEGFINYEDYQYDYDYQRYIYNSNFLKRNKLYFPKYLRYQDPPFFIKTMAKAKKFYVVKNITNIYRQNIYKDLNLKQAIDLFNGLEKCLQLGEKLKLYKLYKKVIERLNLRQFIKTAKKYSKNKEFMKILTKIIKNINIELINKNKLNVTINDFFLKLIKVK